MKMWRLSETVLALLLAGGFASVGELVLGRRSRRLADLNSSFLVGIGICAGILILISPWAGRFSLLSIFVLMAAAAVARIRKRSALAAQETPSRRESVRSENGRTAAALLLAVTVGCVIVFAALNARVGYRWDGFRIWAVKATVLFCNGGLRRPSAPGGELLGNKILYPPAVPLSEALVAMTQGSFDFDAFKPLFLLFYLSLLLSSYRIFDRFARRSVALLAVIFLAILPAVATDWNVGGYADMPMAAFVAAAAAECLRGFDGGWRLRSPGIWLLAVLPMVKKEGAIYLLAGCAALLLVGLRKPGGARRVFLLVPPAVFLAIVGFYRDWIGVPDETFWPVFQSLQRWDTYTKIPGIVILCLREMFRVELWGVLWPIFALAAVWGIIGGPPPVRFLAVWSSTCLLLDFAIYPFSKWDVGTLIPNSFPRLLEHIVPLAVGTVVAAYGRFEKATGRAGTVPEAADR